MYNNVKEKVIPVPDLSYAPLLSIDKTGEHDDHPGVTFIAGEGKAGSDIMFISSCVAPQEASKFAPNRNGGPGVRVRPRYLRSDAAVMFSDILSQEGIDIHEQYYTALVKWLLPKSDRIKIPKDVIRWCMPSLETEIANVKPKIIVCLGKVVFDQLMDFKLSLSDAKGAWFWSNKYNAKVYVMEDTYKLVTNPEYLEKFRIDAREINRTWKETRNIDVGRVELNYTTITNSSELSDLVHMWRDNDYRVLSVDCEWAGSNHVDGQLRSTQFSWAPGQACYVRWLDDKGNYVFDIPYMEAGDILATWLNQPHVKYIGHHFSADAPWLHTVLGLDWYEKCIFDTEFAQQVANEYEDLSLERLALKYTDLGRYDLPLLMWKKANKDLMVDNGYGAIPDDIIIPYACADCDVVIRAWPILKFSLEHQGLLSYYENIFLPFVTDVFTNFALVGLPMDTQMLDELRKLYSFAKDKMEIAVRTAIQAEAATLMYKHIYDKVGAGDSIRVYTEFTQHIKAGDHDKGWELLKRIATSPDEIPPAKALFEHYVGSPTFNLRSAIHMKRWLFDVKGYEPVKSTSNKAKGLPAMAWEKVKNLPKDVQQQYNPAVDKQTLQILAESNNDVIIRKLLQLNAVGNISKAFLKEPNVDEDGNIVKEQGLHFYLCSDGRTHGQYSTTETGRPRAWKPNSLNWPSYVNGMISKGVADLLGTLQDRGELPEEFEKYVAKNDKDTYVAAVPSIRSCVKAPEGWCFVESDYQTAEVRSLGFISGDNNLIDLLCKPDVNFGVSVDNPKKTLRLSFPTDGCIPSAMQNEYAHLITKPDSPLLKRKADGLLMHPKQDLHWALAEVVQAKPREIMDEKIERFMAKSARFGSVYGASATTMERKIEQDTGHKPEPGIGDRLLKALAKQQPIAEEFLRKMENLPIKPGYYRAASGRIRHFVTHGKKYTDQMDESLTSGLIKSMGREARNYPFQESVASTAARAGKWLLDAYMRLGMKARPMIILYDSVVTLCPLKERFQVAKMHQTFMTDVNKWKYDDREFNYPIDTDFVYRWTCKPAEADKKQLTDTTWEV